MVRQKRVSSKILSSVCTVICFCLTFFLTDTASAHVTSEKQWFVDGFRFVKKNYLWKGEDYGSIEVWRNGRCLLRRQAHDLWLYTWPNSHAREAVEAKETDSLRLIDLNNDGAKDFAMREWSGGAYCCYTYEIFSLTDDCKRLWYDNAGCGHLKIVKDGTRAELAIEDASFLYWNTFSLDGPRPIVYMCWRGSKYAVDRRRMLKSIARSKIEQASKQPLSNEWQTTFIQLIYTGHAREALELLEKLPSPQQRKEFATSFYSAFRKSPFYYQIVPLNDRISIQRIKKLAEKA